MGLLDLYTDPNKAAILGMASGLLQAGAPSRLPVGFGQAIGAGLHGLGEGASQAMQMRKMQMQMAMGEPFLKYMQGQGNVPTATNPVQSDSPDNPASVGGNYIPGIGQQDIHLNPDYAPQQPPQMSTPQRSGGIMASMPPDVLMSGIASGVVPQNAFDIWKYLKEGSEKKAGSYYRDPETGQTTYFADPTKGITVDNNGNVGLMPGFVQSNAAVKGSEAGAVTGAQEGQKAKFDLVPVYQNGQMVLVPKSQLVSGAGTGSYAPTTAPFGTQTYNEETAKASAGEYNGMQKAAADAQTNIAKYQRLQQLLSQEGGGGLAPHLYELQSIGKSVGINIGPGDVARKDAAQAIATSMIPELIRNAGISRMTEKEIEMFSHAIPTMSQTAEGRKQMFSQAISMLNRQVEMAAKARAWQQRFGRIDAPDATGHTFADYADAYARSNPIYSTR